MPKRSSNPFQSPPQLVSLPGDVAAVVQNDAATLSDRRNAAAVALGRLGGLKGGPARARKMDAEQRRSIASHAAKVRWAKSGEFQE